MRQNFFLFLISPLFLFATIEIATKQQTKKEIKTPKKVETVQASTTNNEEEKQAPILKKKKEMIAFTPSVNNLSTKTEITKDLQENGDFPKKAVPPYLEEGHQKQFFITLILICLFILFALIVIYIFKRASPMSAITRKNSRNNIKILERRSLSPQTYLYHIQVGDKQFILSESKVEVRDVATLDWPEPK